MLKCLLEGLRPVQAGEKAAPGKGWFLKAGASMKKRSVF